MRDGHLLRAFSSLLPEWSQLRAANGVGEGTARHSLETYVDDYEESTKIEKQSVVSQSVGSSVSRPASEEGEQRRSLRRK